MQRNVDANTCNENLVICVQENEGLKYVIFQKDSVILEHENIGNVGVAVSKIQHFKNQQLQEQLNKANKTIARKTFWQYVIGAAGLSATGYLLFH